MKKPDFKTLGKAVIDTEAAAVVALAARLDARFETACELLLGCRGRVVVTGMGKSGHIGNKIAATLASTGTPAFFVHPGEASHGDLGMITGDDVVIALSNSGATDELVTIIPIIKRLDVPLITLTGNDDSRLARDATVNLNVGVEKEACPLGLAPTASTTAALVMGDALAVALLDARGFGAEDFARSHPGGKLGRRLLVHVSDIMHTGADMPVTEPDVNISSALLEMTAKGLGMTMIVADGRLQGVFTDGDLRRVVDAAVDVHAARVGDHMTANCTTVLPTLVAAEALSIMEEKKINGLPVVAADGQVVGAFNMHDLLQAGVI